MLFKIYGPYEIPRVMGTKNRIDPKSYKQLQKTIDEQEPLLLDAKGCYVISIAQKGGSPKPWYVGETVDGSFRKRLLKKDRILEWNDFLYYHPGRMEVYFVAEMTIGGKFKKKGSKPDIAFVENLLIQDALIKNKSLANIQKRKKMEKLTIDGYYNSGQGKHRVKAGKAFRKMMG